MVIRRSRIFSDIMRRRRTVGKRRDILVVRREEEEEVAVVWCVWLVLGTEDALVSPVNVAIVKKQIHCALRPIG